MIRVLLDEGVPNPLARWLLSEDVEATPFPNTWKALDDGSVLRRASAEGFDVLATNDRNMPYQQGLMKLPIAVLVLPNLRLADVRVLAPLIVSVLPSLPKSVFTLLGRDGRATAFDPNTPKA